jgi:TRAP-type C4-dicarboxylate transport system permease small subunit
MGNALGFALLWQRAATRLASERGEGVISTAIAVLIIAFLGVAMWFAFDLLMNEATETISNQVQEIGG